MAPIYSNEKERLQALKEFNVLDTESESDFDDITLLASQICHTPIALVSLIDENRQWFKSKQGLTAKETPRDISFCGHAIHENKVFIVNDSLKDDRFIDNPLATGSPFVRFYAGAPLVTKSGHAIGTLCVIHNQPYELSDKQIQSLESLSRVIVNLLELRKSNLKMKNYISLQDELNKLIQDQQLMIAQSSKMASLGEMAGGIAHEINNPLAIIQGNSARILKLFQEGLAHSQLDEVIKCSDKIEKTTERIAKIIDGLKQFSRDGSYDPMEVTSIRKIINDTLPFCESKLANHKINLRINDFPESYTIDCRPVQISQVILNLISNAADAIQNKNEKWIQIFVTPLENQIFQISVTDCGSGIPVDIANKIMQPFFTTKGVGKGTGLGLSISKGIIESHNGRFYLDHDSAYTKFVIEIPKKHKNTNEP